MTRNEERTLSSCLRDSCFISPFRQRRYGLPPYFLYLRKIQGNMDSRSVLQTFRTEASDPRMTEYHVLKELPKALI